MLFILGQTLRRLIHQAGFTATILMPLCLCIGANVAIYAVVDAILVRPLPFPDANRLVAVHNSYPRAGAERSSASMVNYYDRRRAIKAFASVAIQSDGSTIIGGEGTPNRVPIAFVSPEFFATLGVSLALGRMFGEAEMLHGPDHVAVLTDRFWRVHCTALAQINQTILNPSALTACIVKECL